MDFFFFLSISPLVCVFYLRAFKTASISTRSVVFMCVWGEGRQHVIMLFCTMLSVLSAYFWSGLSLYSTVYLNASWGSVGFVWHVDLNSHLRQSFRHVSMGVEDMESEWFMFFVAVAEVAAACFVHKAHACHSSSPLTSLWTPEIRDDVRLKKDSYREWLALRT